MSIQLKIKSFDIDHAAGVTHVVFHEWDGKYFCAACALDKKKATVEGTVWNSPAEVLDAVKRLKYGNNI